MPRFWRCSIDIVANGCLVRIGDKTYRKVSPMICENVRTGELLYDARLFPQWRNTEPPIVIAIVGR